MIHTCVLDSTDRPPPEKEGGKAWGMGSWENHITGGALWPETQEGGVLSWPCVEVLNVTQRAMRVRMVIWSSGDHLRF